MSFDVLFITDNLGFTWRGGGKTHHNRGNVKFYGIFFEGSKRAIMHTGSGDICYDTIHHLFFSFSITIPLSYHRAVCL